jgi:hypothetical protein
VLVVGLVVAWPTVPNEDPGMLSEWAEPLGVLLTMLTLVAGIAWAVRRAWSGQISSLRIGLVELALALFVVLAFIGAPLAASYKRAAYLTAWSWVGFACLCFLIRRFLTRAEDQHALLAVLLAGAVSLSVGTFYHTLVEWPRDYQTFYEKPWKFDALLKRKGDPTEEERLTAHQKIEGREESATFFHPATLAGFLVLLLPGLVGATVASLRAGLPRWQTLLTAGCAVIVLTALCLTRQPLALAAVFIVGLVAVGWSAFLVSSRIWAPALVGLLLLGVGGYVLFRYEWLGALPDATLKDRWSVVERAVGEYPLFGIGGSHFALFYPHFQAPIGAPRGVGPGNFVFQIAAEFGLPALLALLLALGLFLFRVRPAEAPATTESASLPEVRWEFQLGGTLGILLGFILRAAIIPEGGVSDRSSLILGEAIAAGIRAVVWFGTLALLEGIPWSATEFRSSLRAGVAGLLLFWLVSDGVGWPSLVGVLWVVVGLGLAGTKEGWALSNEKLSRYLPLPILAAVGLGYGVFVLVPVCGTAWAMNGARTAALVYVNDRALPAKDRAIRQPADYLDRNILAPLREAALTDPDNALLCRVRAGWYGQRWALDPRDEGWNKAEIALKYAGKTTAVNPLSPEGDLAEFQLRKLFASMFEYIARKFLAEADDRANKLSAEERANRRRVAGEHTKKAQEQWKLGVEALARAIEKQPTQLKWRYSLADLLARQGERPMAADQARIVLKLNEEVRPDRRLDAAELEAAQKLAGKEPAR